MESGVCGEPSTLSRASTSWEGEVQGQSLDVSLEDASEVSAVSKFISESWVQEDPMFNLPYQRNHVRCRACCLELDHDELDLVVLGQIQAHRTTLRQSTVSKGHHNVKETFQSHADYFIHGVKICLSTFQFIHCLSDKCFRNLTQHYDMNGLVTRVHGNSKRLPHNVLTLENTEKVTAFIKNYAPAHGLPLPGRVPGQCNKVIVLPANYLKAFVYRKYQEACSNSNTCVSTVGRSKFYDMWLQFFLSFQ